MVKNKPEIQLLVLDLDNTIWDWLKAWHISFSAQLEELAKITNIPAERLKAEMKAIHKKEVRQSTAPFCMKCLRYSHLLKVVRLRQYLKVLFMLVIRGEYTIQSFIQPCGKRLSKFKKEEQI